MGKDPKIKGQATGRPVAGKSPATQKTSSEIGKEKTRQATESFADELRKRGVIVREVSPLGSAVRVESRLGKLTPEEEAQIDTLPKDKYKATNSFGGIVFEDTDEPTQQLVRPYMELEHMSFDEAVKTIKKEKAENEAARQEYADIKTWQTKITQSKNWDKVNEKLMPVAKTFEEAVKQYDADRSVNVRDFIKQAHSFLTEKQLDLLDQTARARIRDYEKGDRVRPRATSDGYGTNPVYDAHKFNTYRMANKEYLAPWTEFVGDFAGVPQ